jgi:hypothetical protein
MAGGVTRACVEAQVVKDLDMYEMCVQAREYEQRESHLKTGDLEEFFEGVRGGQWSLVICDVASSWLGGRCILHYYDPNLVCSTAGR